MQYPGNSSKRYADWLRFFTSPFNEELTGRNGWVYLLYYLRLLTFLFLSLKQKAQRSQYVAAAVY